MNEKPILFSGEMVRAILEGRKTQTRRVMKVQPDCKGVLGTTPAGDLIYHWPHNEKQIYYCKFPYDHRLWVRENFSIEKIAWNGESMCCDRVVWKADRCAQYYLNGSTVSSPFYLPSKYEPFRAKWKPSIHMPRWASRLLLDVVRVRVERVQDITRDDAKAEGVSGVWVNPPANEQHYQRVMLNPYVANYSVLWDEINGERGFGWDVNPWVWVLEYFPYEVSYAK